ncbi:hypothetical protein BJV82DRAFT_213382 [Fennellomyces sp. T-0311]|nr:hypothetical protein BJV82DRAFT_213382 [Fennellomyces sp. T-0311]
MCCILNYRNATKNSFQPHVYMDTIAEIYEKSGELHRAAQARVISHGMSADKKVASWSLFMALLLALESDDYVRADSITKVIEDQDLHTPYLDMQVLLNLSAACKSCDHVTLKRKIAHELEHLELLLEETDTDLLLRRITDPMKRGHVFVRLQVLAAKA